jgi:hypothetical protein
MTPAMWMLVDLIISNTIKAAMNEVSKLTPDQVAERTVKEEARKQKLTNELYGG